MLEQGHEIQNIQTATGLSKEEVELLLDDLSPYKIDS